MYLPGVLNSYFSVTCGKTIDPGGLLRETGQELTDRSGVFHANNDKLREGEQKVFERDVCNSIQPVNSLIFPHILPSCPFPGLDR